MLLERLLETIARHVEILDEAVRRGIDWSDTLSLYAVLHALQVHAQATIDYLLHACSSLGESIETPISCITVLERRGLLDGEAADILRRLVRFRNIVVHEYGRIDVERVKRIVESRGYTRVLEIIRALHERLREEGVTDP